MGDQTLRVAQLGYDTIAASNMPTSEQIHSMLDRSRSSALATPGCSLLAARYHDVPLLAEAWGIGHIGLPFSQNGQITVLGTTLPLPEDSDLVASLSYLGTEHMLAGGSVRLRVEQFAPDPTAAQHTTDSLNTLLSLLRGIDIDSARRRAQLLRRRHPCHPRRHQTPAARRPRRARIHRHRGTAQGHRCRPRPRRRCDPRRRQLRLRSEP